MCIYCNMIVIENEVHFLLVCQKYRHLRIKYFKPYFVLWLNVNKFKYLMSSQNKNTLLKVSKYLYYEFRERSNQ